MTTAFGNGQTRNAVRASRVRHGSVLLVSDDVAEPADHIRFYLCEQRRRGTDADVAIHRVRDQIRNRGVKDAAAEARQNLQKAWITNACR